MTSAQWAGLVPLALTTLWMRGPLSGAIPVGLEPVLMLYGRIYPPWLVTLVAAGASAIAEAVSLRLMRGMFGLSMLERVRHSVHGSKVMRQFERRPQLAIAFTALSPVPDWITRTLAAVSRYPIGRYVLADTIGRLPKLFIPAALGMVLPIPERLLFAVTIGSIAIGAVVVGARLWRGRRAAIPCHGSTPC
jgi:uncharacterized membrane protein YdjX (TVP38/TMEM64 family)